MAPRAAILAAAAVAGLTLAGPAEAAPGRALVKLSSCHTSPEQAARYADFTGQMKAVPGTARMQMRFTLHQKLGDGRFQRVPLPELRQWRKSRAGARAFNFKQRVGGLHDAGSYKVTVSFRWLDASGAQIAHLRRRSPVCYQPGPLPDLQVLSIDAAPGPLNDSVVYSVTVKNTGHAVAQKPFFELNVDGALLDEAGVDYLLPQQTAVLRMSGPFCRQMLLATADPQHLVTEENEYDNRYASSCPFGSSPPG